MVIVIAANLLKLLTMLTVLVTGHSRYVVTLGGAVASCLSNRDPATNRKALLEGRTIFDQITQSVSRGQVCPAVQSTWARVKYQMLWSQNAGMRGHRDITLLLGTSKLESPFSRT